MSIYQQTYGNGFGNAVFGQLVYSSKKPRIEFSGGRQPGATDDDLVSFGFSNGSFSEYFPVNIQNTLFSNFRFKLNRGGNCLSFEFELNQLPDSPIVRYTTVQIKLANEQTFYGYITKRPIPGEDETLKFSGYGFEKRIEKVRIKNPNKFYIQSISKDGDYLTLSVLPGTMTPSEFVGFQSIISDNIEDKNNGIFEVLSNTNDEITVFNPAGIANTSISGGIRILPIEWTESVRFDILFKQICGTSLRPSNQVIYDPLEIEETTGILTAGMVDWEGMEWNKFQKIANNFLQGLYYVGVNGSGRIFLKKKPLELIDKYFAGFQFPKADLNTDEEVAGNIISIYRADGKSGSRKGAKVAAIAEDQTSIAKYGDSPYSEDIPAWLSNGFAQSYANAILTMLKDPKVNGSAKNMPFRRYQFGSYGYVTQSGYYPFILNEFDNFTGWTTSETITRTLSNTTLMSGSHTHRLTVNSGSLNGIHVKELRFRISSPQNIIFFMQNTEPVKVKFGIGIDAWDEYTWEIESFGNDRFFPYKLNCIDKEIPNSEIHFLGFEILSETDSDIYLDFLHCYQYGALHYELDLDEVEYVYEKHARYCNLKFGDQRRNPGPAEFIAGVRAQVEIAKEMIRET
ncbi:hypothetical protein [Leptospira bandrabouensis]|uniref:hypothetical protein n=1 Tax=Leptospira bandrabouensis TaxID=2484903 RepID=UPI0010913519|nr:hypothetical protein [Leptospira bandrabouensis]TGN08618.1 hypothetical protein EHR07_03625 [Leptospira bandrabouensis]